MSNEKPNPAIMIIEAILSVSAGICRIFTIADKNSVKNVKLAIKPKTIPNGFDLSDFLPPTVEDKMIGKIGKMHGDKIVITPAINANNIKSNIRYCSGNC